MFKIIITIYCLVGLLYNVILLPKRNMEIYKQNQYILERYKKMDETLDAIMTLIEIGLENE